AVIGSGPETATANEYITYPGFLSAVTDFSDATLADLTNTRQIVLTPNANPDQNQFTVRNNASTTRPEPNYGAQTQPVVAAVINKTTGGAARRFSISEPVGGYSVAAPSMLAAESAGLPQLIEPPLDIPLDFTDGEGKDVLMKDGTKYQHRVMHLQRLANPLQPFDATSNPYRTIDTIGADLTCFNGVESKKETTQSDNDKKEGFESLQRGDPTAALPNPPPRQLWKRNLSQTMTEVPEPDMSHFWAFKLHHTLGYLNSSYAPTMADMATDDSTYPGHQRGDLRVGPGESAFPLLMWNNRPFNSVYELLNVPRSHSSTLLKDFTTPTAAVVPYNNAQFDYGHLFNFYFAPQTVTLQPGNPQIGHFYRILDYLRVPSKFVESDSYFPFAKGTTGGDYFNAPFNRYSNFRDPGLININTVYSEQTWNAILNGATGPTFAELVASRRGYAGGADQLLANNMYPTEFANPFRPSGFGQLAPITDMEQSDIECTLLRSKAPDPAGNTPPNAPPLLAADSSDPRNTDSYNDVNRHAAFRQQTIERLSNTLTTRSNVYAVWVTIGYFEVESSNGLLGQELYSDTGEVKRHRGFYLIDRSIPVGFEPGENHNVDRSILLRRFIE
ncbi:MAG TPA: hypothetical protein VL096_08280, partial [Pirellulaceae bacterium]|nr:hypothetical protein [Pirellulaceae bacterium]